MVSDSLRRSLRFLISLAAIMLSVATFNVRGLVQSYKRDHLIEDAASYNCDVVSIQETKIVDASDTLHGGYRLILFAQDSGRHYGLGFIVSPRLCNKLDRYWRISDRIACASFRLTSQSKLLVINAYAPTNSRAERLPDEADKFYTNLERIVKTSGFETIIIAGDFNAKVGQRSPEACVGSWSRGRRNDNGTRLVSFCETNKLFIANTAFRHPARHITTWEGARSDIKIFNQIDYVIVHERNKSILGDARSYAGTLVFSDHRIVVVRINISHLHARWAIPTQPRRRRKVATATLISDNDARSAYASTVRKKLSGDTDENQMSTRDLLNHIGECVQSAGEEVVGFQATNRKVRSCLPVVIKLSAEQKSLRMQIRDTKEVQNVPVLKKRRNEILQELSKTIERAENDRLDGIASEVESARDGAGMFAATKRLMRKDPCDPVFHDSDGHTVTCDAEKVRLAQEFFTAKYEAKDMIEAFVGPARPLENRISESETRKALLSLKNNKAAGPDGIQGELLKYAADEIAPALSEAFNRIFERNDLPDDLIGKGDLKLLQKPGKKPGPLTHLRPIVLLTMYRKTLSTLVLKRIQDKVGDFLPSSQSAFRKGRSTADVVWAHRWWTARIEKYRETFTILGIDMTSAFDTIDRSRLLDVLETIVNEDELRMIRVLLAQTSLHITLGTASGSVSTMKGSPQGDCLSPVLFTVYLEAALRTVRVHLRDVHAEVGYADDIDFIIKEEESVDTNEDVLTEWLDEWDLIVNRSKTEKTKCERKIPKTDETWGNTKKLGSMLGSADERCRRQRLALAAFNKMHALWLRRNAVSETRRLRLYKAYVMPILTYNCGCWDFTKTDFGHIDIFHRKQLRRLIGKLWPHRISNANLYRRCDAVPISQIAAKARWRLFGHVLRLPRDAPAQTAVDDYFEPPAAGSTFRGRPRTTLPRVLNADLEAVSHFGSLKNAADLGHLRSIAEDRVMWRNIVETISRGCGAADQE